jgi:hypothetical protein
MQEDDKEKIELAKKNLNGSTKAIGEALTDHSNFTGVAFVSVDFEESKK